jgi:hypothetical protein
MFGLTGILELPWRGLRNPSCDMLNPNEHRTRLLWCFNGHVPRRNAGGTVCRDQ